jgi:phosphoribosyl 1,2-cyclic phosphodiesterase
MYIRFWGVRGSIAAPLTNADFSSRIETAIKMSLKADLKNDHEIEAFVRNLPAHVGQLIGGDTACVEVRAGDRLLILDAGTGIRPLGLHLIRTSRGKPIEADILLTHTHWDHISGIPFFVPAYNPANILTIYGSSSELEDRLKGQQAPEYFPVPLVSTFKIVQLKDREQFQIGDVHIETFPLNHPGASYAYRITHKNKTVVYATDSEYKDVSSAGLKPFADFFYQADILIYDAQFTFLENIEKEDWGHSNMFYGIDIAIRSDVKKLVFTHHEPAYDDRKLWKAMQHANEYLKMCCPGKEIELYLASEGLTLTI